MTLPGVESGTGNGEEKRSPWACRCGRHSSPAAHQPSCLLPSCAPQLSHQTTRLQSLSTHTARGASGEPASSLYPCARQGVHQENQPPPSIHTHSKTFIRRTGLQLLSTRTAGRSSGQPASSLYPHTPPIPRLDQVTNRVCKVGPHSPNSVHFVRNPPTPSL